ncbi:MAG: nucleolar RNA-binding Nop10p family protein [Asgard group archaeon]|nr:nucleolar RNA-binding Nop10p family protein [Asgard group archaeon]
MSLRKCPNCKKYTLLEQCPQCSENTIPPAPPKFSLVHEKKYGKYRRALQKKAEQKEKN